MRILFFTDSLASGGKERRLTELLKSLKPLKDIEFELIVMHADVHYKEVLELGIKIHFIIRKSKKDLSVYSQLYKVCDDFKPEILHCWDSMTAVYSVPVCKILGIKLINGMVVDTPVNQNILNKYWLRARITFPFSKVVVGNSNAGLNAYKANPDKSVCIYNGMDLNRFESLPAKQTVIQSLLSDQISDPFIIGMVAAFEERKDHNTLINAALKLVEKNDKVIFILVGGGVTFGEMKKKVPENLLNRILFLGKRSDIESIVNVFDIAVLLTNSLVHGEGISNSIIEYMALSKPLIATRGGGTDELITDGKNGFLIGCGDETALLQKLELLMNNSDLRNQLGANAHELVIQKFDLRIMTKEYLNLYKKILN